MCSHICWLVKYSWESGGRITRWEQHICTSRWWRAEINTGVYMVGLQAMARRRKKMKFIALRMTTMMFTMPMMMMFTTPMMYAGKVGACGNAPRVVACPRQLHCPILLVLSCLSKKYTWGLLTNITCKIWEKNTLWECYLCRHLYSPTPLSYLTCPILLVLS